MFVRAPLLTRRGSGRVRFRRPLNNPKIVEVLEPRRLLSTYVVNVTGDPLFLSPGQVSLRSAISRANTHAGADTISFSSAVFPSGSARTLTLQAGALVLSDTTGATTISGPGSAVLTVSGHDASRVFEIDAGVTAAITGLSIVHGFAIGQTVPPVDGQGGGIYSLGSLSLRNCVIEDNTAVGGNARSHGEQPTKAQGGGVYSAIGSLSITGCVIAQNSIEGGQGFNQGDGGADASGGGIYCDGALHLASSIVTSNTTDGFSAFGRGGGIFAGSSFTISDCTIDQNVVRSGGNILYSAPFPGALGGGLYAGGGGTLTRSTLSGNEADGGNGFSYGNTERHSTSGSPGSGGAIAAAAQLILTNCTLTANHANGGRGGSSDLTSGDSASNGGDASGGAIASSDSLYLNNTTISGNTAFGGLAGYVLPGQAPAANGASTGGGISITFTLTHATLLLLKNSIVSANHAASAFNDIAGVASSSSGNNLIGIGGGLTNGVNGNHVGVNDPILGTLASNGGPTQTLIPLPGSPVIDAGSNSLIPSATPTDQRGYNRIAGARVDIGAVEYASMAWGLASMSGLAFNDLNANGLRDANEAPLPKFMVYVDAAKMGHYIAGDPVAVTDSNGKYAFKGIADGTYKVGVVVQSGWRLTAPAGGFHTVTLVKGSTASGENFALTHKALISGSVFNDANGNGKRDAEPGLPGWRVYLDLNKDGKWEASEPSVLTDSSGNWSFGNLSVGTYVIRLVPQKSWKLTTPPAGSFALTVGNGSIRAGNFFGEKKV